MDTILSWATVLALFSVASTHAQELLTTDDGLSLRGTVRLLQGNAATCNVIAENEQGNYEARRANQDQPLHLWELEFSVFNGSGRALDHLVAYYDIASQWPPCTNWTEQYEGLGLYQWADPSGRIQRTGEATPTLPNEALSETIRVLAFNGVRPSFIDWSVNYTFMDSGEIATTPTVAETPQPTLPTLPEGVTTLSVCANRGQGASCWMELGNIPGCYVWNSEKEQNETALWSGQCTNGFVNGTGSVTWVYGANRENERIGYSGPYLNGKRHGLWVIRQSGGHVFETPYVNGVVHGTEVRRSPRSVTESPHVNGVTHGISIIRHENGDVEEWPYVNGQLRGTRVLRRADGRVEYDCHTGSGIDFGRRC